MAAGSRGILPERKLAGNNLSNFLKARFFSSSAVYALMICLLESPCAVSLKFVAFFLPPISQKICWSLKPDNWSDN